MDEELKQRLEEQFGQEDGTSGMLFLGYRKPTGDVWPYCLCCGNPLSLVTELSGDCYLNCMRCRLGQTQLSNSKRQALRRWKAMRQEAMLGTGDDDE